MITLPNYDNQSFEDIMEMVRRRIPIIYPQWTDLNEHDPGITILELFAWLKEMQQYHLNRITARSYESMLELLGTAPCEPQAARACVVLPDISTAGSFPEGMRFETAGETIFESGAPVNLNNFTQRCIYINDGVNLKNVMDIVKEPKIFCYSFGRQPVEGKSSLYIGFDRLEKDAAFRLFLQFDDSYPVKRNPFKEDSGMPRDIVWEYGVKGEEGLEFKPLEVLSENTFSFSQSGEVVLKANREAYTESLSAGVPKCCWIRARLLRKGCEENPRLLNIFKDTVEAIQKKTLCETLQFMIDRTAEEHTLELRTWLAVNGRHMVFVRDGSGWLAHYDFAVTSKKEGNGEAAFIRISALPKELAADGRENIRVLCYEEGFESSMVLKGSNGLPCQRFFFRSEDAIITDRLSLMIYEEPEDGEKRWIDWAYTPSLSKAGPYDRCFTYDSSEGEIAFGDNEQGAVPMAGDGNILITNCITTRGSLGNIPQQDLKPLQYGNSEIRPYIPVPASGGRDAESIPDVIDRVQAELKKCVKAVTTEDYEELAGATPGLRVMGARAIPYYDPDSRTAGDRQAPATVTVAVLPYNEEPFPVPDREFIEAVKTQLEKYRLVTTHVKVIAPVYVKITANIEVVVENNHREDIDGDIAAAVEEYFIDARRGIAGGKPCFGQPVLESAITMKIGTVPGVVYVKKVGLSTRNNDSYKDKYGNIVLPPHGLPYLGDLQVRTML